MRASSFPEEAAAVPMAATTALHGLHAKGAVQPGQSVLIHGASGGVGTCAVQIARAMGEDLRFLSQLIEDGALRPVVERYFTLSEAADAFRHFESGHAAGKIVIRTAAAPSAA